MKTGMGVKEYFRRFCCKEEKRKGRVAVEESEVKKSFDTKFLTIKTIPHLSVNENDPVETEKLTKLKGVEGLLELCPV